MLIKRIKEWGGSIVTLVPNVGYNVLVQHNHLPAPTKARETSDATLLSLIMAKCLDEKRKSKSKKPTTTHVHYEHFGSTSLKPVIG